MKQIIFETHEALIRKGDFSSALHLYRLMMYSSVYVNGGDTATRCVFYPLWKDGIVNVKKTPNGGWRVTLVASDEDAQ